MPVPKITYKPDYRQDRTYEKLLNTEHSPQTEEILATEARAAGLAREEVDAVTSYPQIMEETRVMTMTSECEGKGRQPRTTPSSSRW